MAMMRFMQKMGRSLMIPISVMPAASILYSLGQIQSDHPLLSAFAKVCLAGGSAILDHISLLFAVGIAIGFTSGSGIAALSAVVGYLVFENVLLQFQPTDRFGAVVEELNMGALGGIATGMTTAFLYERYKEIQLPKSLGFFSGRRFVPIAASVVMAAAGTAMGLIWLPVQHWIRDASIVVLSFGDASAGIYGFLNRLLIPTGLHHIVNNIAWQVIGEYTAASGKTVHGDLNRYFAGDPSAGVFMTGFYPVMMFGLPAAAIAMARSLPDKNKQVISPVLYSAALTSFLTGITEPIEFSFLFAAPLLYAVHAALTGFSMALMYWLDVHAGFSFSAGLIDLLLNWNAKDSWIILLVGIVYFAVYYLLFSFMIRGFKLKILGAEETKTDATAKRAAEPSKIARQSEQILSHLGGAANVVNVDACITRLRLVLKDDTRLNENELRMLGALGIMTLGNGHVHLIYGTDSELIKEAMLTMLPDKNKVV